MKRLSWFTVVMAIFLSASLAYSNSKPVVAVFNIEDQTGTLAKDQQQILTDYLSSKLAENGIFSIIPRSQIKARLAQKKLESYKACYDQECQIDIGRELAANKSISSKVIKIGSKCTFTAVLYDLRKAASEGAASAEGNCLVEGLVGAINKVAHKLTKGMSPSTGSPAVLKGGLLIKSMPPAAEVWLDGVKQQGLTPLTLNDISAVEHHLFFRLGSMEYSTMVRVIADQYTTITAELKKSGVKLVVLSNPPEASILLNGEEMGKTPQVLKNVDIGEHTLVVRKEGYLLAQKTLQLMKKGHKYTETFTLAKAGIIEIDSTPSGAHVLINGQDRGKTPLKVSTAPGKHMVKVVMEGQTLLTQEVTPQAGSVARVSASLDQSKKELQRLTALHAQRKSKKIWGLSMLAGGLALAASAGVMYGIGVSQGTKAHDQYNAVKAFNQTEIERYRTDVESARMKMIVGHVLMGSAALTLGFSIYQFVTRPKLTSPLAKKQVGHGVALMPVSHGFAISFSGF